MRAIWSKLTIFGGEQKETTPRRSAIIYCETAVNCQFSINQIGLKWRWLGCLECWAQVIVQVLQAIDNALDVQSHKLSRLILLRLLFDNEEVLLPPVLCNVWWFCCSELVSKPQIKPRFLADLSLYLMIQFQWLLSSTRNSFGKVIFKLIVLLRNSNSSRC